jgi:signal peptidase I
MAGGMVEPRTSGGAAIEDERRGVERPGGRAGLGCAIEVVETLVLTLVIFFLIQNFVAQPFQVQQFSMQPTLQEDDYVLVDRITPRWDPYARGEVVVFRAPERWAAESTPFIKRVIGVGGDTVEITPEGQVIVNDVPLDEPYLFTDADGNPEPTDISGQDRWVVPDGELFVMGDHRRRSADSRTFGPIPIESVVGRGVLRYWPLGSFGVIESAEYDELEDADAR